MRSHAKASTAGQIQRQAPGLGRPVGGAFASQPPAPLGTRARSDRGLVFLLSTLTAVLGAMALMTSTAGAAESHAFLGTFGTAAQPSFGSPAGLAVDQSSGDLLVIDTSAGTVSRFNPDGTPANFSALGTNVIDGQGLGDGTPQGGLDFGAPGEVQVAVDNSGTATDGNIYVTRTNGPSLIDVFASTGAYLGQLTESSEGAFGGVCGVGVDSAGAVYVGDHAGRIHKFVPAGNPPVNADNVFNVGFFGGCSMALGTGPSAGLLFAAEWGVEVFDSSTGGYQTSLGGQEVITISLDPGTGHLYALNGSKFTEFDAQPGSEPSVVSRVDTQGGSQGIAVRASTGDVYVANGNTGQIEVYGPLDISPDVGIHPATDVTASTATLHGTVNPDGEPITECRFEYGSVESGAFAGSVPCEGSIPTDSSDHQVSATISGLPGDGSEYHFRLVAVNLSASSTSGIEVLKRPVRVFTGTATGATRTSASVTGVVRPEGEQLTDCRFEYGPTTAYGSSVPCSPGASSIPADFGAHTVSAELVGLAESTTYYYRLVIADSGGTAAGGNQIITTRASTGLPDGRVWEMVSPVDKNESDVRNEVAVAAADGNGLIFTSPGSFAGQATAQVLASYYLSERGPSGWTTTGISPPGGRLHFQNAYMGFSADLSRGVIRWMEDNPQTGTIDPNAQPGMNLYMRDNALGSFQLLNGTLNQQGLTSGFVWGSRDFGKIGIESLEALTADAPCSGNFTGCAYEWDHGTLRLASILPTGEPTTGAIGNRGVDGNSDNAVSDDGARVFFESPGGFDEHRQLYVRENGTSTKLISESERALPGGISDRFISYQGAETAHGGRVIFTTESSLVDTDADTTNDLYLYDFSAPADERLTLLSEDHDPALPSGAEVENGNSDENRQSTGGVLGRSEDLRRIYFVAKNQILPGQPSVPGPKLYLWDDTGEAPELTYVAALSPSDDADWRGKNTHESLTPMKPVRVSRDGRFVAFLSSASLIPADEGQQDIYLYDAVTKSLQCASCRADASPASGTVGFDSSGTLIVPNNHLLKNVSDSGQLFFQTTRGLLPRDSNGKTDVYEYDRGRLRLISPGSGDSGSYFLDASPSGNDVFIVTADRLVGWDVDGQYDAYDARVGGGLPEPPPPPPACEGDACQPPPLVPNDPSLGSASFNGPGDPSARKRHARRCGAGKVRRHGKCRKKQGQHTRAHRNHHPTRSHG